jgi:hypothetical protein
VRVLYGFTQRGCEHCEAFLAWMEAEGHELCRAARVRFAELRLTSHNGHLIEAFRLRETPTILLVDQPGDRVRKRWSGWTERERQGVREALQAAGA